MKLPNKILFGTLMVSMLVVCVTAAAHESLYQAVQQGDVYAGRDRNTARLTLGVGLAVSAFPLSVPV
jgi:hypothetical protein